MTTDAGSTAAAGAANGALLGVPELRRLILSLLASFQDEQLRTGRLSRRNHVASVADGRGPEALDKIAIDDAGLGIDSLALLDLVGRIDVFFGLSVTGIEDHLLLHRQIGDWVRLVARHLERMGADARLTFETSGSIGAPKRIVQARAALESEVAALREGPLRNHRASVRILSSVPLHHIYGFLWGVLLPMRSGWTVHDLPPGAAGAILREAQPGDLVLATPFTWDRVAALGRQVPAGVTGISSGGPSTGATWAAGASAGLMGMIEVYGSTETGGLGWRTSGNAPYRLMPDITRDRTGLRRAGTGPLPVQDNLVWTDPGAFLVEGRLDTTVQVAGVNVDLDALQRLIAAQPGVAEAAVRPDGDRLKAFIATEGQPEPALEDRLREAMLVLPPPSRPVRYAFGPKLPRTATGKLADW